jgi:opacity protein-like surface antigen
MQLLRFEPELSKINVDGSLNYGATVGVNATDNLGVEFMWNRQPTVVVGRLSTGNSQRHVGINVDQYQGNFLYTFFEKEKLRPFILVGVGSTKFAGRGESDWRISYGVGGGVKYFFTRTWACDYRHDIRQAICTRLQMAPGATGGAFAI